MFARSPTVSPHSAAIPQWLRRIVDVILHVSAHGTGARAVRHYLDRHASYDFALRNVTFWTPRGDTPETADRAQTGFGPNSRDATALKEGAFLQARMQITSARTILVSDADARASSPDSVEQRQAYPQAGERLKRFVGTLNAPVVKILLAIRNQAIFRCVVVARGVLQGAAVPSRDNPHRIAYATRGWRELICDMAEAVPGRRTKVFAADAHVARPDRFIADGLGVGTLPLAPRLARQAPTLLPELHRILQLRGQSTEALPFDMGCWNPFTTEEHATLRNGYAGDLLWLTAGADSLATLIEDRHRYRTEQIPSPVADNKGRNHDIEERHMARPGER